MRGRLRSDARLHGALLVGGAAAGIYLGTLACGFVFDDALQVLDNPWIRDFRHLGDIFSHDVWAFAGRESNYYRPLMHVAYAALYVPFGPSAAMFHAINVVLHVAVSIAVFVLLARLVPATDDRVAAVPIPALAGALIFAAHPVHVEAVAWVSGLPDVACALFFLLGLLAYLDAGDAGRPVGALHAAGAACFLAAALFKEPGVTFPAVVAAVDLATRSGRRGARYWLTRYGGLAAATAVYFTLRIHALGGMAPHASDSRIGPVQALHLAGVAAWRYVAMLLAPHPLNVFQTMATATPIPSPLALLLPIAAALAIARRSVPWTAACALFLVPLLPSLYAPALLPGIDNPWAERYLYLPSAGFALAVALAFASLERAVPWGRRAVVGIASVAVLACAALAVARIPVWHDDLTLWRDATAKSPDAGAAHGALGHALFVRGDIDGAVAEYRTAIRLKPNDADSLLNLGVALAIQGRHAEALPPYEAAVRLEPRRAVYRADLAISLSALGRHEEALAEARRAVALQPDLAKAYHALGVALGNSGSIAEAADAFRRAIALDPSDTQSRANLRHAEEMLRSR